MFKERPGFERGVSIQYREDGGEVGVGITGVGKGRKERKGEKKGSTVRRGGERKEGKERVKRGGERKREKYIYIYTQTQIYGQNYSRNSSHQFYLKFILKHIIHSSPAWEIGQNKTVTNTTVPISGMCVGEFEISMLV